MLESEMGRKTIPGCDFEIIKDKEDLDNFPPIANKFTIEQSKKDYINQDLEKNLQIKKEYSKDENDLEKKYFLLLLKTI